MCFLHCFYLVHKTFVRACQFATLLFKRFNVGELLIQLLLTGELYGIAAHQHVDNASHSRVTCIVFASLYSVDRTNRDIAFL